MSALDPIIPHQADDFGSSCTVSHSKCAVTVILPIYNCARFLDATFSSLLGQTWRDFEIVAIDDGSTDDSWNIMQRWAASDERVRLLRNERNMGISATRNRGLIDARAPWITVMGADDLCLPERLERQMQHLVEHPELDMLGCHFLVFNEDPAVSALPKWKRGGIRGGTTPGAEPCFIIRASLFEQFGPYDTSFELSSDHEMFARMFHHGARIDKLREPLILVRRHGDNITLRRKRTQTKHTLRIYWRMLVRYRIRMTPSGFGVMTEQLAQFVYLSLGIDRIVPRSFVHRLLRRNLRSYPLIWSGSTSTDDLTMPK